MLPSACETLSVLTYLLTYLLIKGGRVGINRYASDYSRKNNIPK